MQSRNLSYSQFDKGREKLVKFFRQHGDKRITKEGIQWIRRVTKEQLEKPGSLIHCVVNEKMIVGVLIISNYGIDESFMAVHEKYRNQDIAQKMVEYSIKELGKVYGRVALDNIPSMKVCFHNGLVAFHLFDGPTGKPTFWLGGGNWRKEDVL